MMKKALNKEGYAIVEATFVLPILILTVLSMIMLIIYFHSCLDTQINVHKQLIKDYNQHDYIFKVVEGEDNTIAHVGGAVSLILRKDYKGRYYLINEAKLIRLGEVIESD